MGILPVSINLSEFVVGFLTEWQNRGSKAAFHLQALADYVEDCDGRSCVLPLLKKLREKPTLDVIISVLVQCGTAFDKRRVGRFLKVQFPKRELVKRNKFRRKLLRLSLLEKSKKALTNSLLTQLGGILLSNLMTLVSTSRRPKWIRSARIKRRHR
jgi:hypothetical protein